MHDEQLSTIIGVAAFYLFLVARSRNPSRIPLSEFLARACFNFIQYLLFFIVIGHGAFKLADAFIPERFDTLLALGLSIAVPLDTYLRIHMKHRWPNNAFSLFVKTIVPPEIVNRSVAGIESAIDESERYVGQRLRQRQTDAMIATMFRFHHAEIGRYCSAYGKPWNSGTRQIRVTGTQLKYLMRAFGVGEYERRYEEAAHDPQKYFGDFFEPAPGPGASDPEAGRAADPSA